MSGTGTVEGQGVTIAFATLSLTLNMVDLSQDGVSVADINCSDQDTTGYEDYVGGTLKEGGTYTVNVNWNMLDHAALFAAIGTTDTVTITYLKSNSTNTIAPSDAFPAYINNVSKPTIGKNDLIKGTIVFKIAGDITVTDEAA
jgi:hypothetical protein